MGEPSEKSRFIDELRSAASDVGAAAQDYGQKTLDAGDALIQEAPGVIRNAIPLGQATGAYIVDSVAGTRFMDGLSDETRLRAVKAADHYERGAVPIGQWGVETINNAWILTPLGFMRRGVLLTGTNASLINTAFHQAHLSACLIGLGFSEKTLHDGLEYEQGRSQKGIREIGVGALVDSGPATVINAALPAVGVNERIGDMIGWTSQISEKELRQKHADLMKARHGENSAETTTYAQQMQGLRDVIAELEKQKCAIIDVNGKRFRSLSTYMNHRIKKAVSIDAFNEWEKAIYKDPKNLPPISARIRAYHEAHPNTILVGRNGKLYPPERAEAVEANKQERTRLEQRVNRHNQGSGTNGPSEMPQDVPAAGTILGAGTGLILVAAGLATGNLWLIPLALGSAALGHFGNDAIAAQLAQNETTETRASAAPSPAKTLAQKNPPIPGMSEASESQLASFSPGACGFGAFRNTHCIGDAA